MKKYLHLFGVILLLLPSIGYSQETLREIHGSKIIDGHLFNYTYIQSPRGAHSFLLQPLNTKSKLLENVISIGNRWNTYSGIDIVDQLVAELGDLNKTFLSIPQSIATIKLLADSSKVDIARMSLGGLVGSTEDTLTKLRQISGILKKVDSNQLSVSKLDQSLPLSDEDNDVIHLRYSELIIDNPIDEAKRKIAVASVDSLAGLVQEKLLNYRQLTTATGNLVATLANYDLDNRLIPPTNLQDFNLVVFKGAFADQLGKSEPALALKMAGDKLLDEATTEIFYTIKARLNFEDVEPIAAVVVLARGIIPVYNMDKGNAPIDFLDLEKATLEFENGTIKNIEILLKPNPAKLDGRYPVPIRFRNNMPISIISKFSPERLKLHSVFNSENERVDLADVIEYYPKLINDSENYAPANTVVDLSVDQGILYYELKKEKTSLIADVRIYSDFRGFQEGQPNGLIQTEISRKIDLISWHKQIRTRSNWTALRYVEPRLVLSKIEDKDKYLVLVPRTGYSNLSDSTKFDINSIQLNQYQFVRIGADLNFWKLNIPPVNFQILGSLHWIGTSVADYVDNNKQVEELQKRQVYSLVHRPAIMVEVKPDSRWGAFLRYDFWGRTEMLSSKYTLTNKKEVYKTINLELFLKTSATNKFYFRYLYNWTDKTTNFYQMQIGYQASLFGLSKDK